MKHRKSIVTTILFVLLVLGNILSLECTQIQEVLFVESFTISKLNPLSLSYNLCGRYNLQAVTDPPSSAKPYSEPGSLGNLVASNVSSTASIYAGASGTAFPLT